MKLRIVCLIFAVSSFASARETTVEIYWSTDFGWLLIKKLNEKTDNENSICHLLCQKRKPAVYYADMADGRYMAKFDGRTFIFSNELEAFSENELYSFDISDTNIIERFRRYLAAFIKDGGWRALSEGAKASDSKFVWFADAPLSDDAFFEKAKKVSESQEFHELQWEREHSDDIQPLGATENKE